ncbi:MAG: hypothetical protein AAF555_02975 [Verrucomicrobiota bacterium]
MKILASSLLLLTSPSLLADEIAPLVETSQKAHGLEAWWGKEVVSCEVSIVFGGQPMVDATFTFQAHGPQAKMETRDGLTILFDGETAWTTGEAHPMDRFHVLTWPWFVMAPYKMVGDGITLSDYAEKKVGQTTYQTFLQTFASDMGDAPEDWYRLFIEPETQQLDWMSYIVTYGKSAEEANQKPSVIHYEDYASIEGVQIAQTYTFYLWDKEKSAPLGDPKGTGQVKEVRFLSAAEVDFTIPEGAQEIPLP